MISKKTYIPAKPRNKKLIGGMMVASGSTVSGGPQHSHANKEVIDRLTQPNIDVLSKLSLYQTGVEMVQAVDEFGAPIVDEFGAPVMIEKLVPVIDSFGNPVLDLNGDPVMETVPVYAIKSTASFFSEKEVSAYGLGDEGSGGGGGGGFDMLLAWDNYSPEKSQWVISAALAKDMLDRIVVLEAGSGGGGGGSAVSWGSESGGYVSLTVDSVAKSIALSTHTHSQYALSTHDHSGVYEPVFSKNGAFNKDFGTTSTTVARGNHTHSGVYAPVTHDHSGVYAPVSHNHSGVYEPVFSKNGAFNKDFGTTSGTVAQGDDSRIVNGATAYGWGNHASAGYASSSSLANYVTLATTQTISGAKTFSANLTASVSVTTPKVIFAAAGWSLEQTGTELQMKYNGTAKMRFLSGGSIVATQEITAYGLGDEGSGGGGGGGGYDMLLSWTNYSAETEQWVISAALAKDMLDRIVVLEAGSGGGGSTVTWGTESGGYALLTVEGVSKSVALSTHNHSGVYEPVFSKNTAFNKDFGTTSTTVARGNHTHSGVYEPVFTKNEAFNKDFGTTSGTVAEGNDSRIVNGQTAYGWGNHASAGYASSSSLANYVTLATTQTISGAKTFSANLTASESVTTPKVIFAAAGWSMEQSGTELQMKYNGAAKMRFLSGGSIVATQEITAYG